MDIIIKVLEFVPNQILIILLAFLIIGYTKHLTKEFRDLLNEIKLLKWEIMSIDYSCEKHIGNGYGNSKREKKEELIKDNKAFIN